MIFSIKKYLRSKKNKHYQDELIEKLNKEHTKLFEIVTQMDEHIQNENLKQIKKLISKFKKELELHLLYEDTNLYEHLYLRYQYYPEIKNEINAKHEEMKNIAKAVHNFIETHYDFADFHQFKTDFENVKNVLVKRVSFEEDVLYDIYNNMYKVDVILYKFKHHKR